MLFEIEADYPPQLRAAHGDINSWEILPDLVIGHRLHRQCQVGMALLPEGVTRRSVKTNENPGVIQVAVIVHRGAQTQEILVNLAVLVVPCHGSDSEGSEDRNKREIMTPIESD